MNPRRSLRVRITVSVGAVVLLSLAVAFVAVYRGTSGNLRSQLDGDLRGDITELRAAVTKGSATTAGAVRRARTYVTTQRFRPTSELAFVVAGQSAPVTNQPELLGLAGVEADESSSEQRREDAAGTRLLRSPSGYSTASFPDLGQVRVLVRSVSIAGRPVRLGIAQSLQPVTRAEEGVRRAFVLAAILALAAAAAAGFLVATRTAAPLRRMARVAGEVEAGDLAPRMAIAGRDDEIQALAHAFDQMLDRLEDAFARQAAFVADASHELRTPLTVIRGQFEVLAMSSAPSADEVRRVERIVRVEIDRMNRLVDDLMLLATSGDEGFLHRADVSLPAFLGELTDGMRTQVPGLELDPVPDVTVRADPDRLAQAIRNLLTNAVIHAPGGGTVHLRAAAAVTGVVRIEVDDHGPGVDPADRDAVFGRFHRLDGARDRAAGGAGLGLSIVQAIAEAHGGRATVAEAPGGGARFAIDLPAGNPRSGATPPPVAAAARRSWAG